MRRWVYFEVSNPNGRVRLETLRREEAIAFTQGVYNTEKVICEIHEIERSGS
jgi:hypothetical protein